MARPINFSNDAKHWRHISREAAKRTVDQAHRRIRSCQENIDTSKKLIEYAKALKSKGKPT